MFSLNFIFFKISITNKTFWQIKRKNYHSKKDLKSGNKLFFVCGYNFRTWFSIAMDKKTPQFCLFWFFFFNLHGSRCHHQVLFKNSSMDHISGQSETAATQHVRGQYKPSQGQEHSTNSWHMARIKAALSCWCHHSWGMSFCFKVNSA